MIPPPPSPLRPIVVIGPTAGGKSELAVAIAQRLGAPIISADSMQVYRHLDAGTAKPPRHLREQVPHHLIDLVEPDARFTVADWLAACEALLASQGRWVIVGGTNLYLKALLEGLSDAPDHDASLRAELMAWSDEALHTELVRVDPDTRIHRHDRKRMVRALEVHRLTGKAISTHQQQWERAGPYRYDPILIGLRWEVEAINRRINARVKAMFEPCDGRESLPDEVARLRDRIGVQAAEALGYKQVLAALRGEMTMEQAMEQTKIQTRQFAKRQRTWLKRFRHVHWLDGPTTAADPARVTLPDVGPPGAPDGSPATRP